MACGECISRGLLLRDLAPNIDKSVAANRGNRARDLLALPNDDLASAVTPSESSAAAALAKSVSKVEQAALLAAIEADAGEVLCRHQDEWPAELRRLGDAEPHALYLRGDSRLLAGHDGRGGGIVTVVGARRAGTYGREVAESVAAELSCAGITVMSGMALGIDSCAHEGALRGGGGTIAVLGSGPERAYPRSRSGLYRRIVERGLVVSELPPGTPTFRWSFPARNRVMAALAELTVVVESAERSGTLITAEMAADCGRLVGAVPGPVNSWRSEGANLLLRDGAVVIRGASDAIEAVFGPGAVPEKQPTGPELGPDEEQLLDAVEAGSTGLDAIASSVSLGAGQIAAGLTRLELAGYLDSGLGAGFRRTSLRRPA